MIIWRQTNEREENHFQIIKKGRYIDLVGNYNRSRKEFVYVFARIF
jgi:hypothetical protein